MATRITPFNSNSYVIYWEIVRRSGAKRRLHAIAGQTLPGTRRQAALIAERLESAGPFQNFARAGTGLRAGELYDPDQRGLQSDFVHFELAAEQRRERRIEVPIGNRGSFVEARGGVPVMHALGRIRFCFGGCVA